MEGKRLHGMGEAGVTGALPVVVAPRGLAKDPHGVPWSRAGRLSGRFDIMSCRVSDSVVSRAGPSGDSDPRHLSAPAPYEFAGGLNVGELSSRTPSCCAFAASGKSCLTRALSLTCSRSCRSSRPFAACIASIIVVSSEDVLVLDEVAVLD